MNIDWIVAISFFLVVTAWSFSFYSGLFVENTQPLSGFSETFSEQVTDYLTTETYIMHVNYTDPSGMSAPGSLNFSVDFDCPSAALNSAKVYEHDGSLISGSDCQVGPNFVKFSASVNLGEDNQFTVRFQNSSSSAYCTGSINPIDRVMKGSAKEMMMLVSSEKINDMGAMTIEDLKGNLSINRPFRIEIEINETVTYNFGMLAPNSTSVYVRESWSKIAESGDRVLIRTMVW